MLCLLIENSSKSRLIIRAFAPYRVFLSVYQIGFYLTNVYSGSVSLYSEYVGFLNLAILCLCFLELGFCLISGF